MNNELLYALSPITDEEQALLTAGEIDRDLYMNQDDIIRSEKLMAAGRWIEMRPHTRFARFPAHRHDFVELVYMCAGQTTHIVDGREITLKEGELLLMAQHTIQEILPAAEQDIAVNFILLPPFFEQVLPLIGEKDAPLRRFLMDCLCGEVGKISHFHFKVADVLPIQNLMENLLYSFVQPTPSRRQVQQSTMELLFLHLLGQTEYLAPAEGQQALLLEVYRYIETHYKDSSLITLADKLHFAPAFLSRQIKKLSGRTYTELLQDKRLSRAAFLLRNTPRRVEDIARSVGYDNISYFHRLFQKHFGMSPRKYRNH